MSASVPTALTTHQLAVSAAGGNHDAGIKLIERLWKQDDDPVTVTRLIRISGLEMTPARFDALADLVALAHLERYRREVGS